MTGRQRKLERVGLFRDLTLLFHILQRVGSYVLVYALSGEGSIDADAPKMYTSGTLWV